MKFSGKVGWFCLTLISLFAGVSSCHDSIEGPRDPAGDLSNIPYNPVTYILEVPIGFPALEQPADNPMTVDGIQLGRKLFYDPILSIDSTVSCSSCHQPSLSFTDGLPQSVGVAGTTRRGSIGLINVGFHYSGLFWDGRASTLEQLALIPIEDPIEMAESWNSVELKLQKASPTLQETFKLSVDRCNADIQPLLHTQNGTPITVPMPPLN